MFLVDVTTKLDLDLDLEGEQGRQLLAGGAWPRLLHAGTEAKQLHF